jgi:aspartate aminotransferase
MTFLSKRINNLSESQTIKMAKLGRELTAKGIDVINLSFGEPDFFTPEHVKEAAKKAVDENYSYYTPVSGYPELRKALIHLTRSLYLQVQNNPLQTRYYVW